MGHINITALPIRALLGPSQTQGFRSRLVSPVSPGLNANCRLLVLTRPHKSQAVLGLLPIANYPKLEQWSRKDPGSGKDFVMHIFQLYRGPVL